jgi:O-antigen/teichoic acid export membrane protein
MSLPAAPARPVRPGLAIALALLVGMFSTVFGLGALFDSEGDLAPVVRLLMPAALLLAPITVGVILRPLGASTAILGASMASGTALFACAPVAMLSPAVIGALTLLGGIVAMLWTAVVVVRQRTARPLPPRLDVTPGAS